MIQNIVGREKEIETLNDCLKAKTSQLVIVYGRRRVGKTFLINQFFDNQFSFKVTGIFDKPKEFQLKAFTIALCNYFDITAEATTNWMDAFNILRKNLSSLRKDKLVVFFDEFPWMDTQKSDFLSAFEWFWNDWGCAQDNLICIVCGSATSWMVDKIDHNKGGLFNRQNYRLYLEPFNLYETRKFLESKQIEWSIYDIAQCYMIMGGIPFYLNFMSNKYSLSENIDNIFFKKKCTLWDEFEHLYHTLFFNSELYISVVEFLSTKRIGFTRKEIAEKMKLPQNGYLTKVLNNLVYSGFVRLYHFYGNKKKQAFFQLSDYYTLFYYKFLRNRSGKDECFWSNSYNDNARLAWQGFTFEQMCRDHVKQIKQKLSIAGVLSEESAWLVHGDSYNEGAQIDMLIDRKDRVINVCEIKFCDNLFEIDKDYEANLRHKISKFVETSGTKKTIQLTFITTYGVKHNTYSGRVTNEVILEDLFNKTII